MIKHDNTALLEPLPAVTQSREFRPAVQALVAPRQFEALDGFRFVAISAIIAHHATGLLGFQPHASIAQMGILVNYFFVLSGFVLAHQYPRIDNAPQYFRYLGSRFARVVPVCVFTLLLTCLLNPMPIFDQSKFVPAFFANLFLVQTWFSDQNYYLCFNAPSWTLSVDMFLYLLLPLALLFSKRGWWFLFATAGLTYVAGNYANSIASHDPIWANFFFPPIRIFDFAMGVLTYKIAQRRAFSLSLVATLFLEIYLLCSGALLFAQLTIGPNILISQAAQQISNLNSNASRIFYHIIPTIDFAVLVLVLTSGNGILSRLFSCKPLVLLGKISCSLYLLHFPIIVYLRIISAGYKPAFSPVLLGSVAVFLIAASLLLFLVFEDPARKFLNQKLDQFFALRFPGKTSNRWHQRKVDSIAKVGTIGTKRLGRPALIVASLVSTVLLWLSIDGTIKSDLNKAPNPPAVSISELGPGGSFVNSLESPKNVCFGDSFTLHKIQFVPHANKFALRTLWQATAKANNSNLAVHLLNEKGEIVKQYDHMLLQRAPEGSLLWCDSVEIESTAFSGIKNVGLVVVVNKAALPFTSFDKVDSDWGSHRLLIECPATSSSTALVGDTHQEK